MAQFDEDLDDWVIRKEKKRPLPRLVAHNYRRPITEYALDKDGLRYRVRFVCYCLLKTHL